MLDFDTGQRNTACALPENEKVKRCEEEDKGIINFWKNP
jgi:hypothetical protein